MTPRQEPCADARGTECSELRKSLKARKRSRISDTDPDRARPLCAPIEARQRSHTKYRSKDVDIRNSRLDCAISVNSPDKPASSRSGQQCAEVIEILDSDSEYPGSREIPTLLEPAKLPPPVIRTLSDATSQGSRAIKTIQSGGSTTSVIKPLTSRAENTLKRSRRAASTKTDNRSTNFSGCLPMPMVVRGSDSNLPQPHRTPTKAPKKSGEPLPVIMVHGSDLDSDSPRPHPTPTNAPKSPKSSRLPLCVAVHGSESESEPDMPRPHTEPDRATMSPRYAQLYRLDTAMPQPRGEFIQSTQGPNSGHRSSFILYVG